MERERIIFTSPHIIENIFKYLNARDLSSCAQVCSLWYGISKTVKKRRGEIVWMFKVGACRDKKNGNMASKICKLTGHSDMEIDVFEEMDSMRIQPVFCTAFMSVRLFKNFSNFFPCFDSSEPDKKKSKSCEDAAKRKYLNSVLQICLKSFLPVNCPVTFTVAQGIIGCDKDCIPVEIEEGVGMAGFFLPEMPGVQINHLPITGKNSDISQFITSNAPVKALLMFMTSRGMSYVNKLLRSCHSRKPELKMAIGGAIVDHTESLLGSVTAFSGPNVEAASVIINAHDKVEEISAKLEVFKETGLPNNRCFAYMFACVSRGYHYHRTHNVESSTFSKMYPNVPLIGIFGNGEVGLNYFPNVSLEDKKLRAGVFEKCRRRYLFGYTTVFVLISIKE